MNTGVSPSINQNCHHQIGFAKVHLNIFYPRPYTRLTWDYGKLIYGEAINNATWTGKKPSQILMYTPKLNYSMTL